MSKAPVNDPALDFRRLVEPYAQRGEISDRRRKVLRSQWQQLGLTDEAAETIINSVLEPFRRRLANLAEFEKELRKEVDAQFPLPPDIEQELRDLQKHVLGLADEDVAEIWEQVIAETAKPSAPLPSVQPTASSPAPAPTHDAHSLPLADVGFDVATFADGDVRTTRKQGKCYREDLGNNVFLELIAIPGGRFQMGSTERDREQPVHEVAIAPFFLGKYPVTQAQWQVVAALPKVNRDLEPDPAKFKGGDRPVEQVSWWEAVEFCDRLSRKTGRTYRLPSEAEWEYACRAGTTTPFHFGETITTDLANYNGNSTYGSGVKGQYRRETTSVGSFGVANAFGLYDMHGNVWEWCADHWHENYTGAPVDGSAWLTKDENAKRLMRGGSWVNTPVGCRSAFRYYGDPGVRTYILGFRVVCVLA